MAKCGKGCMPECGYFTTGGCISPFSCPYKIETGYINSATSIPTYMEQYNGMSDDDVKHLKAEIARLTAENAELRERLDKAIEPPVKIGDKKYMPDCDGTMVLEETVIGVRLSYDNICGVCVDCVETRTQRGAVERFTYPQWQTLLYDTREATEARLKEIKEKNND